MSNTLKLSLPLVLTLASVAAILHAQEQAASVDERVAALIQQLDSEDFDTREAAEKGLLEIGLPAKKALAEAGQSSSAEMKQRAARLLLALRQSGLRHVETIQRDDLGGICTVMVSKDGQFLYAGGWRSSAAVFFRREPAVGTLQHEFSLSDRATLNGLVCLRISPDGRRAVSACFYAKSIVLFSRDAETGALDVSDTLRSDPAVVNMQLPIDAVFSPDSKFVYAIDDRGGALIVLRVTEKGELEHVQSDRGQEDCLQGARGVVALADGKTVVVTSGRAGTLSVFDRDPATGKVKLRQVLRDGKDGIQALAGVLCVCASPDGKFVYVSAGRFQGDQGVGVYRVQDDGKLSLVQEFVNGGGQLNDFRGGNGIVVSPDGLNVYACGTTSRSLACFERDPNTGKLTVLETIHNATTGSSAQLGAADVECSLDGRFVYVALEDEGKISVFERKKPSN